MKRNEDFTPFAIDGPLTPGVTLLEASAGTGKTYSIAALCLRLVVEYGLRVDELLIVTFTKAATAELRERIRARFAEAAAVFDSGATESDDPVLHALLTDAGARSERRARVEAALASFDTATISTIHGFCQQTLRDGAFETGAELDLEVEGDHDALIDEVVEDYLHRVLVTASPTAYTLCHDLAELRRSRCRALARQLVASPDAAFSGADPDPAAVVARDAALEELREAWLREGEAFRTYLMTAGFSQTKLRSSRVAKYLDALDDWLSDQPDRLPDPKALTKALELDEAKLEDCKTKKTPPPPQAFTLPRRIGALAEAIVPATWGAFVQFFRETFEARRASSGVISFDDLLQQMSLALDDPARRPAVQAFVRGQYRAALIDEFQDTDRWQWSIFSRLFDTDTHHLFLIGDPKQSIYRFRGADIATYLEARKRATRRHRLEVNWRSDGPLLRALNRLYARAPALAPGIEYAPVRPAPGREGSGLVAADGSTPPALRLRHLPLRGRAKADAAPRELAPETVVAADVVALLRSDLRLREAGAERGIQPVDIAILVDSHAQASRVAAELRARGVPAVRTAQGDVFNSEQAGWMSLLLQAWLAPRRSSLVRAVMASPLRRVDAQTLASLDDATLEAELVQMQSCAQLWARQGIAQAWRAFARHGALARRLAALEDGARAWTNYEHLVQLLHAQQVSARLGPVALARWFESQRQDGSRHADEAREIRLDRDDAALSIVTVHGAKGLEYPIVFYPFAGSGQKAKTSDFGKTSTFTAREGSEWVIDLPPRIGSPSPDRERRRERGEALEHEEAARKLYVTLTRPQHQLHVYWGGTPAEQAMDAPLTRLLLGDDGRAQFIAEHPKIKEAGDELAAAVYAAAQEWDPSVSNEGPETLEALELGATWQPPRAEQAALAAPVFARSELDRDWRRSSYSSLVHGSTFEIAEGSPEADGLELHPLEDELEPATTAETLDSDPSPARDAGLRLPLADFERGAEAGTFLHAFFEHVDFTRHADEEHLSAILTAQMSRHGIDARWTRPLLEGLSPVLTTPLGGPLGEQSLAAVALSDRIDELGFELPVMGGYESADPSAALRAADFARVVARHRRPHEALPADVLERWEQMRFSAPARGFLTGAVDLVFRAPDRDGQLRYFVADYKSNWLGDADRVRTRPGHYAPPRLVEAMMQHDYHLQYHLYTLAVHRHLRARLGGAYDYARDFGGVYYLFVRGMIGPETPRALDGSPYGVFFDRLEPACIDALDRLFAGESSGTAAKHQGATSA